MPTFVLQKAADRRLDEIYLFTRERWGEAQADAYITGMFDRFQAICDRRVPWKPVPAEFGVTGFFTRYQRHYIYWAEAPEGHIRIVTILHERMHQLARFQEDTDAE